MKNQIVRVALFSALMSTGLSVMAQQTDQTQPAKQEQGQKGKMTPEQRADMRVNRMKQNLNLTDEQASKVKALILEEQKEHSANKANAQSDRQKMMDQMASILTPEQMKKFKEMHSGKHNPQGSKQD